MSTNSSSEKAPVPIPAKKPYKTPTVRYESVFEVSALSCGKITTSDNNCKFGGTKNS